MLWNDLECRRMSWNALECPGILWNAVECSRMPGCPRLNKALVFFMKIFSTKFDKIFFRKKPKNIIWVPPYQGLHLVDNSGPVQVEFSTWFSFFACFRLGFQPGSKKSWHSGWNSNLVQPGSTWLNLEKNIPIFDPNFNDFLKILKKLNRSDLFRDRWQ